MKLSAAIIEPFRRDEVPGVREATSTAGAQGNTVLEFNGRTT